MKIFGRQGLKLEPGSRIVTDKTGLTTGSATWTAPKDRAYSMAPSLGTPHPYLKFIALERVEITFDASLAKISGEFAGMDPNRGEESEPVYELQIGVNEEPIPVHPDFVSKIGGRPSKPLNGAIFINPGTGDITTDDKLGIFEKFALIYNGERNPFAGLEAYFDASDVIFRKRYTARSRPSDIGNIATIDSPDGPQPSLPKGSDWLYIGMSYSQRGNVFSVSKEWKASARGGWNKLLYA